MLTAILFALVMALRRVLPGRHGRKKEILVRPTRDLTEILTMEADLKNLRIDRPSGIRTTLTRGRCAWIVLRCCS